MNARSLVVGIFALAATASVAQSAREVHGSADVYAAPGVVLASGNRDLGSPIEFRSSLEVSFVPVQPLRFGIALSHVSNGRLGQHNPGVETLTFNVAIPLKR